MLDESQEMRLLGRLPNDKQGPQAELDWGALAQSLGLHIRLAETASAQVMSRMLGPGKRSAAQITAIELIGRNPGVQPGSLARALALEPSNLATMLRHLEACGLVRTEPGQDRRTRVVSLTASGQRERAHGARLFAQHQHEIASQLSQGELQQLIELLKKVSRSD